MIKDVYSSSLEHINLHSGVFFGWKFLTKLNTESAILFLSLSINFSSKAPWTPYFDSGSIASPLDSFSSTPFEIL